MRRRIGDANRSGRDRPRSGPNIPESQRHTKRLRISELAYALAAQRAVREGISPAALIERLLLEAATPRRREDQAIQG